MATRHQFIHHRADFFRVLDETIAMNDKVGMGFRQTLEKMKQWTANGRTPTETERASLDMTGGLAHAYDSLPPELQAFADRITELSYYFEWWPSDADWNDEEANHRWLLRSR